MSSIKVSELPDATAPAGDELIMLVQGGASVKRTLTDAHVNTITEATITPDSDGDVTLTGDQYTKWRIVLTDGAWSAAHSVIVPAELREYLIDNTAGSYDATVKTASGTGVKVSAGCSAVLICDGTNVVNADTNGYRLIAVQKLTTGTAATLTLDSRTRMFRARGCGGGGGAGGIDGQGAGASAHSIAGSGAGWFDALLLNDGTTWTYTIGAAGSGGAAGENNGTSGGNTTLGNGTITLTGGGGNGSNSHLGVSSTNRSPGADGGAGSVTGSPVSVVAGNGTPSTGRAIISGVLAAMSVSGFCPIYGGGKTPNNAANGTNATVPGEGGGSAYAVDSASNYAGGNGYRGEIIIEEYA